MTNIPLTACIQVWSEWLFFFQELLLNWLGTALHMWQGQARVEYYQVRKNQRKFQMKLVFGG